MRLREVAFKLMRRGASRRGIIPPMSTSISRFSPDAATDEEVSLALTAAPRLFVDPQTGPALGVGRRFALPDAAAHHVARVLRLRLGDPVTLFDGTGGEYSACVGALRKDQVDVDVLAHAPIERESMLPIRLVQCLQGGDKMDFTLQKAVELGVSEIVPVISRRSVVRLDGERALKRLAHWRQVIISASEQCGRNRLARLPPIESFDRWLSHPPADHFVRIILSPHATDTVASLFAGARPEGIELLVGPEGGLSPEELAQLEVASGPKFCKLRLGPRVLRTETAGLAAIAALHAHWGDFI